MSTKAVICRMPVLLLIFTCCWLGGCADGEDDVGSPKWKNPPFDVKPSSIVKPNVTVTITTKLAASEDPSSVYFTWEAKDSAGTPTPNYLSGTAGPKQTFVTSIVDRFRIKVDASKEYQGSLSHNTRVVPYIYVTCLSEITQPQQGQQVKWNEFLKGDGKCLQSSAPQRSPELTLGDPVQEGYLVSVLVINNERHSGKLSEALVVSPDGTWSKQISIGEESDAGSFTLKLVLMDRNRINDFEKLIGVSFNPDVTIEDIDGKLDKLRKDETGRELFAETSYEVNVVRNVPDGKDGNVQK